MTDILNQIVEKWFSWQLSMLWQVGLLIAIVAGLDLLIRKWAWPQVRYALWLLVLVKLILPPTLTSPTSFTAEIPFLAKEAAIKISQSQTLPQTIEVIKKPIEPIPAEETIQPVEIGSAAPPASVAAAAASLSWKAYTFFIWLVGIAILSGWLIIRLSNLRREHLKDNPQSNLPERLDDLLASTTQKLGLKKVPQVILTNKVCCPAVFGVFRPVLLMPADKLQNLTMQDAENIFLHELAHIKRCDLFIHAVYMILQIVYWFNPLLWLIRKQLQNLRELCCDATVAKILREKTAGYRQTLLDTARQLLAEPVAPGLGLLGLFENSNWLIDRLRWLEKKNWKYRPLRIATIFILICLMATCVLPMAKFNPGPPNLVIKGTVTDAITSKPIAGAKVGDTEEYADGRFNTLTDNNGNYSYKTWYEEHGIAATADGYQKQKKTLLTKLFGSEEEKVINFALEPEKRTDEQVSSGTGEKEKLQKLVEDFFKDNYRDIKQRKTIEWGEPSTDKNGNQTIRYKYEARIWDKDKYTFDEIFTFSKDGKFVSAKKLSQILTDYPVDNNLSAEQDTNKANKQVNGGTGKGEKIAAKLKPFLADVNSMLAEMQPSITEIQKEAVKLKQLKEQNASESEIKASEKRIEELSEKIDVIGDKWGEKMNSTGEQFGKDVEAWIKEYDWEQFGEQMAEWGKRFGEQMQKQFEQADSRADENSQEPAKQPAYPVDFEITKQAFLPGDSIEITEMLGNTDKIETGQTYTVKGKYKLSSARKAMLHIYATNGEIDSEQGPAVKRGTGDFTRTFNYKKEGWLHLSFYPADGGSSFGNLYFAQKGSGQKIPDISTITSIVETPKPAGQILPQTGEQEKTSDLAQIKNVMVTLGGTFTAAHLAFSQTPGNSSDSAAKIMEDALPQFEKFESDVKGTNISGSVHLIIEQIRQIIKANKDGDSARARALIDASSGSWYKLVEIIDNDYRNTLETKIRQDAQKKLSKLQIPAGDENVDVYIADIQIRPYEAGGLYIVTAKIGNRGTTTAPPFSMNFFRGDPKDNLNLHGKAQSGSHGAGPIKPGDFWYESSMPFAPQKGWNELVVILDIDNSLAETDELNNSAAMKVLFKKGKIIEKSVNYSP